MPEFIFPRNLDSAVAAALTELIDAIQKGLHGDGDQLPVEDEDEGCRKDIDDNDNAHVENPHPACRP